MRLESSRDISRTRGYAQRKRKGPVSRTLRQVLPCGFPLGLALRLVLEGVSLRSFLLLSNLPTISSQCKGPHRDESPLCGNKCPLLVESEGGLPLFPSTDRWFGQRGGLQKSEPCWIQGR